MSWLITCDYDPCGIVGEPSNGLGGSPVLPRGWELDDMKARHFCSTKCRVTDNRERQAKWNPQEARA